MVIIIALMPNAHQPIETITIDKAGNTECLRIDNTKTQFQPGNSPPSYPPAKGNHINLNAKMYMNQLEDFVTSKGNWFLSADGAQKITPSDKKCLDLKGSDCYKWINRKINTKDN